MHVSAFDHGAFLRRQPMVRDGLFLCRFSESGYPKMRFPGFFPFGRRTEVFKTRSPASRQYRRYCHWILLRFLSQTMNYWSFLNVWFIAVIRRTLPKFDSGFDSLMMIAVSK